MHLTYVAHPLRSTFLAASATFTSAVYRHDLRSGARSLGPYAPAVLRFRVHFPADYPNRPPLVTFNADIFHPLLTPLTATATQAQLSSVSGSSPSGAAEQPSPPGALSLKPGFPCWYSSSASAEPDPQPPTARPDTGSDDPSEGAASPQPDAPPPPSTDLRPRHPSQVHVVDLLRYMRAAFSDPHFLDAVPFPAAANPSAWYAWRAHRAPSLASKTPPVNAPDPPQPETPRKPATPLPAPATPSSARRRDPATPAGRPRKPGEWNWEGVWEERVRRGVAGSLAEAVLYAGVGLKDEEIHFVPADEAELAEMRAELRGYLRESP